MNDDKLHDLIIHELRAIKDKLSEQHTRIDSIAQELVRIDTERKTEHSMDNSNKSQKQWGWEKAFGIIGMIGLTIGLIITFK